MKIEITQMIDNYNKIFVVLFAVVLCLFLMKNDPIFAADLMPSCTSGHSMCFSATCTYRVNETISGSNKVVSVDRDWRSNGCSCTNPYNCSPGPVPPAGSIVLYDFSAGVERNVTGLNHTLEPGDWLEFRNFTETWPCNGTGPSYAAFTNRCSSLTQHINGPAAPTGSLNASSSCDGTVSSKVDLNWGISGGGTCYLFRDGNSSSLTSGNCSGGSYTNFGLSLNTPYTFYITSTNSSTATRIASRSVTTPSSAICNPPPVPTQARCGQANGHNFAASDTNYTSTYDQCDTGSPSTTAFPAQGSSQSWTCSGGGYTASPTCTATRATSSPLSVTADIKINGKDNSFAINPGNYLTIDYQCSGGSAPFGNNASANPFHGSWSGQLPNRQGSVFNLQISASTNFRLICTAGSQTVEDSIRVTLNPAIVNGVCGVSNNSCSSGSLNDIPDSTTNYLWNCNGSGGGINVSCSMPLPSNASCGTADYRSYIYNQTELFSGGRSYCSSGTPSPNPPANPVPGGISSWTCVGSGGGANASCQARRQLAGSCGPAAKNYTTFETNYTGGLCATGTVRAPSPAFPNPGSSASWWCDGVYGGANVQCTASRNPLSTYELWVYENNCSGNRSQTIDVVESNTLPINWKPDVNRINMKTINGKTLCYEVRQNCSATNVKILGQQNRTYNCSIPNRLDIQPSTVTMPSLSDQSLSTAVICSKGEVLPVQRDLTPANSISWGGSYSSIVTCSPGTATNYQNADKYNLHSGSGTSVCSGNVIGTIGNYIYNGFGWGNLQGNYNLTITRGGVELTGDCPACGMKYINAGIKVPVMQCK